MHNEFTAVIESAEEGGFVAFCPELPGANGQGETVQEAKKNLAEAIELILMDRREDGLRGVPPDAVKEVVSIE
jgi:predicted RNase H-like HicB family nuclease